MDQEKETELVVFMDAGDWRWRLCERATEGTGLRPIRIGGPISIRHSWERLAGSPLIIVHWGTEVRSGGAILEQIRNIDSEFDIGERVVVLIDNPTHEDVVYFAELGIIKTVPIPQFGKNQDRTVSSIRDHLTFEGTYRSKIDSVWYRLSQVVNSLPSSHSPGAFEEAAAKLAQFQAKTSEGDSARLLDLKGVLCLKRGQMEEAEKLFRRAIEKNPKYYRAYNNLVQTLRRQERYEEALVLLKALQDQNRLSVQRMATIGQIWVELKDDSKAEHYFSSALERDSRCNAALNGLAEVRFRQARLQEARNLLAKTESAAYAASRLNRLGIQLVREGKYQEALVHYKNAQVVLPQQNKGSLLYYNIGLCYCRWGKLNLAREYLNLALVKDPEYEKARKLIEQIDVKTFGNSVNLSG